jgi:hypothetical protein
MSINNAFNILVNLQGRDMELIKADFSLTVTVKAAVSNVFRNLSGPEEIVVEGREFVVAKETLDEFGTPERGDRLVDPELGKNVIKEVRPMVTLGGAIIGYRIRTS